MGFLNGDNCRFGTQGQQLEDVEGSTAKGCGSCCDSESDVKNGVTPIETRLLRRGQSSVSDTMLEILNSIVLYLTHVIEYT